MRLKADMIQGKNLSEEEIIQTWSPRTKHMKKVQMIFEENKGKNPDVKFNFIRMKNNRLRERKRKQDILKIK